MARIRSAAHGIGLIAVLALAACGDGAGDDPTPPALACQGGAWRMASGETLALTPATGGLRYRLLDGRSGRFEARDGESDGAQLQAREGWRESGPMVARVRFEPCASGRMEFALDGGPSGTATRLSLHSEDVRFRSGELTLRGRLVLPAGGNGPFPLAVLVHGSEDYSAVEFQSLQYLLPAQGVAVFVYDKRGTGGSEGEYTQDFHVLATDAIAALAQARKMRPEAFSSAGYVGGSQGGWIGPLAASRSKVDYVVALYGLAENALAEDREQVMNDLRAKGHGDEVLAQAREITDTTALLMRTGFTQGFDELDAVRAKYSEAPWLADIEGEYTGQILEFPGWMPRWAARRVAMHYDVGTSWDYEPLPVLAALAAPQLWVIAEDDLEAPNAETLRRLRLLQSKGRPIDLAVFPDTDHGIYTFAEEDGDRVTLRHPDGYLRLLADWIKSRRLGEGYGSAGLEPRRVASAATPQAGSRKAGGAESADKPAEVPPASTHPDDRKTDEPGIAE